MDVNKIFLSSTISQSINEIVNSNTATLSSKINKLNDLLNEYSSELSQLENEYQEGLSSEYSDGALFNRSDWQITSPELLRKIQYYTRAITQTNTALNRLAEKETHESSRDKKIGNIVSAAPLAYGAIEKIKEFYKKHAVRSRTSRVTNRSFRDSVDRASSKMKSWFNRNGSNSANDDSESESSISDSDGSLVNKADEVVDNDDYRDAVNTLDKDVAEYNSGMQAEGDAYADSANYNNLDIMEDWFGDSAKHRLFREGEQAYRDSNGALRDAIERETDYIKDFKSDLSDPITGEDLPADVGDLIGDADDILSYSYDAADALSDSGAIVSDVLDGIEDFLPDILDFI